MKILLYGINYSPELTGIGKYSGEMARWLVQQGHEVQVVTAPPYYPEWKVGPGYSTWHYQTLMEEGVRVTRCPLYVPSRPSSFKRVLHLASFAFSSLFPVLGQWWWKPDLVIQVVPTLFCSLPTLLLGKLAGAQRVVHIQDYEVDALFGLALAKGGRLKGIAFAVERWLLNRFDRVSTISEGMLKRARQKGVEESKLLFFPNWSEVSRFCGVEKDAPLLRNLGVDPTKRVVLYSGNMGEKQGLESVIEAAHRLHKRDDLHFLMVGDGAAKRRLMDQASDFGLENLTFAPLQPYELLPSLLASADCHLVVQKRGAADAVLPSKLTNILAVGGNAVITADPDTTLGILCEKYPGIAQRIEPESVDALVSGIEHSLSKLRPNTIAADYARDYLDKDVLLSRFVAVFSPQPCSGQTEYVDRHGNL
ncbi:colanic acid biosynthesis glycosyltransferase WcaI [Marinobacterium zhoushanense]|uniref:Colanic acid biosynthesis glycosyltransferase WcaI n=1 Tax=Marinobacterium zhoushanense TaxID=1679163 RepID=A0ABQ1KSQ3_9GAMM|nr:glycosyltransferase WbuB [Marinobacterium zhoushanense]GGC06719.1 colanic acid biosynthesis glycosyltransferase WcaI [Marinobacterium zhoushanense]